MMAAIVAKRLVEHLQRSGFVVMKRPPGVLGAAALGSAGGGSRRSHNSALKRAFASAGRARTLQPPQGSPRRSCACQKPAALAGFDDCEAALAEALMAAEAAPERRDLPCGFVDDGPRPREGARIWPIEARRRWLGRAANYALGGFPETGAACVAGPAAYGWV